MTDQPAMKLTLGSAFSLAVAGSIGLAVALSPIALAQNQTKNKGSEQSSKLAQPPRSVIQKLRDFLGLNPPVAVGGSRSSGELSACLLSPWPGQPVGVSTPVLLAEGPLNELRLEQGDQLLWQLRASSTQAIEGPVAWPIRPLQPGEVITLKVRPRGASGGDFATYTLRTADAATLQTNQRQLDALGSDPKAWSRVIESLGPKQASQAAALLSSPMAPAGLRQSLGCSSRQR
jgi:hypothetical protein